MWSDPRDITGAFINEDRGNVGCVFGEAVSLDFCRRNGFEIVVRSHEVVGSGFERWHSNTVVTIFSASAYRTIHKGGVAKPNKGAVIVFNEELNSRSVLARHGPHSRLWWVSHRLMLVWYRIDTFIAPLLRDTAPMNWSPAEAARIDEEWIASAADRAQAIQAQVKYSIEKAAEQLRDTRPSNSVAVTAVAAGASRPADLASAIARSTSDSVAAPTPPAEDAATKARRLLMPNKPTEPLSGEAAADLEAHLNASADAEISFARQILVEAIIERKADLFWFFSAADSSKCGAVTYDTWCQGMEMCMPFSAPSWRVVNAEFDLAIVTDDSRVPYCVFLDRYSSDISPAERSAQDRIMRNIARKLYSTLMEPSMASAYRELDTDGDGQVDFHEFVDGLERLGVGLTRNQLVMLMHAIDTNLDGVISLGEFEAAFRVVFTPIGTDAPSTDGSTTTTETTAASASIVSAAAAAARRALDTDTADCLGRIGALMVKSGADMADLFMDMDVDASGSLRCVRQNNTDTDPDPDKRVGAALKSLAQSSTSSGSIHPLPTNRWSRSVASSMLMVAARSLWMNSEPHSMSRSERWCPLNPPQLLVTERQLPQHPPVRARNHLAVRASTLSAPSLMTLPSASRPTRASSEWLSTSSTRSVRCQFPERMLTARCSSLPDSEEWQDRNGLLSQKEFAEAVNAVGLSLEPSVLEAVIEAIDSDGDGFISPSGTSPQSFPTCALFAAHMRCVCACM